MINFVRNIICYCEEYYITTEYAWKFILYRVFLKKTKQPPFQKYSLCNSGHKNCKSLKL